MRSARLSVDGVRAGLLALALAAALLSGPVMASSPAMAEVRNPRGVAVIIGNGDYQHRDVPDVAYAGRDAEAFKRYVLEVLGFDPQNVLHVTDATRSRMFDVLGTRRDAHSELWSYLHPDGGSELVVFYSGHGAPGLRDKRGYLLPVDADPKAAEEDGYPIDLLYANLGKLEEASSVRVYLDSCFSGGSHGGGLIGAASPVYVTPALPEEELPGKVTSLTAATGKQIASWDEKAGHGMFTHHLLDALYGKGDGKGVGNGDGKVTAAEAKAYLDRHMTRAARRVHRRVQQADLRGAPDVVLVSSSDGVFPVRTPLDDPIVTPLDVTPLDEKRWTKDEVEVREGPGGSHRELGRLECGAEVRVTGRVDSEGGSWLRVARPGGGSGYAPSSRLGAGPPSGCRDLPLGVSDVMLPAGYTLGDWVLLAEERLRDGERAEVLVEANSHLRKYGQFTEVVEVREQAVSGLVKDLRVTTRGEARTALKQLERIEASVGERADLLRWKARAYRLLGNRPAEDSAHVRWLALAPQDHPERREVLSALRRVRAELAANEKFSQRVGRSFSADWMDASTGWTDLHYAALLDLPGVVAALVEAGLPADLRLKDGSAPMGGDLRRALEALGYGEGFEGRGAEGETPLMLAAFANAGGALAELVERGADVGEKDGRGRTALHHAALGNALDAATGLVDRGAGVGAEDEGGETPLDHAARGGREGRAVLVLLADKLEASLKLTRSDRIWVQRGLASLGKDVGKADGEFGDRTRWGIESYQRDKGLPETGYLTAELSEGLEARGREAEDDEAFKQAKRQHTASGYRGYLGSCGVCGHKSEAEALLAEVSKPKWEIGKKFRDCPGCPELVVVPEGSFTMGSPVSEEGRRDSEGPAHRVSIAKPFAVGVYEVTFGEWVACVSGGGCGGHHPGDRGWGRGRRPVMNVSWDDAQGYVRWLSRETGEAYRLLSEAEWEYAARAGTRTRYWWGDAIGRNRANCRGCGSRWDGEQTAPVGSFTANAFGLHDVYGNVWEWVEDCWNDSYRGAPSDGSVWQSGDCGRRVLRGGSWDIAPGYLRSALRGGNATGHRDFTAGFRVARTFTP